ncbi:hypothetical protein [Noviherbaspirillum malthae]|jgi:hypothetical protein|uniref:hypothetical protein n=1 Tax=Noviherbaspirillum malthae TaxID=1260987 RepID=UPI00188E36A9|nr:hypothetical protein [Noviherbaspirillum malthae]
MRSRFGVNVVGIPSSERIVDKNPRVFTISMVDKNPPSKFGWKNGDSQASNDQWWIKTPSYIKTTQKNLF